VRQMPGRWKDGTLKQPPNIEGYEILGLLGRGGMSSVWKARQISLDRLVAIKVLDTTFSSDPGDVQRFVEEARAAARLRHPGIVQSFDAGLCDGTRYFVMELVDGYTVGEWLRRKKSGLGEKQALLIAGHVVAALDYACHTFGIIHCDIKPDNIMIDADGSVKVTDFGLARFSASGAQDENDDILGTPAYMSPEQARGDVPLDCRADIYSLGATLYQIATGQMLFQGRSDDETMVLQTTGTVPDAMTLDPSLSLGFCQMLERMLAKDPAHRHKNWTAVASDIAAVSARRPLPSGRLRKGLSTMERSPERARRMSSVTPGRALAQSIGGTRPSSNPARTLLFVLLGIGLAASLVFMARNASTSSTPGRQPTTTRPPASRPSTPQPSPSPQPAPRAAGEPAVKLLPNDAASQRYSEAIAWIRANPYAYAEGIARLNQVADAFASRTDIAAAARRKATELAKEHDYQLDLAKKLLSSRAYDQANWGLYSRAFAILADYKGPCADELASWREDLLARLRSAQQSDTSASGFPAIRVPATGSQSTSAEGTALLRDLARRIVSDGVPAATSWLDSRLAATPALRRHPGVDTAASMLMEVADAATLFPKRYAKRAGETVYLQLFSGTVKGELLETGERSVVLRVIPTGKKAPYTRTIDFNELHPAERVRVLGGNATPAGRLMFGLQAHHAGQAAQARDSFSGLPGDFGAAMLSILKTRP
jgi:serine/threonine protein kinase